MATVNHRTNISGIIRANIYQVAVLNQLLPLGFKLEPIHESEVLTLNATLADVSPSKRHRPSKAPFAKRPKAPETEDYEICRKVLKELIEDPLAKHFLGSRDLASNGPPNGLLQIEDKLKMGEYLTTYDFVLAVRNLWGVYWSSTSGNSELYHETTKISNRFEGMLKQHADVNWNQGVRIVPNQKNSKDTKKHKPPKSKVMSLQAKATLKENLMRLKQGDLAGIIPIIKGSVNMAGNKTELEFDIDALPNHVCRQLEIYVNKVLNIAPTKAVESKARKHEAKTTSGKSPKTVEDNASDRLSKDNFSDLSVSENYSGDEQEASKLNGEKSDDENAGDIRVKDNQDTEMSKLMNLFPK